MTMFTQLAHHCKLLFEVARLPVARLHFDTRLHPEDVAATHRAFTRPHPRYRLFPHKALGVALIDLKSHPSAAAYLDSIQGRRAGAAFAAKALARGYRLDRIERNDHVDALHAINTSLEQRQGRPMDQRYLNRTVHYVALPHYRYYGVFSPGQQLVAYGNLGHFGNFAAFSQLMGMRNNDGIMHLLVAGIVQQLIAEGQLDYVMYDTFFGAQPGLRNFKTILGFRPYHARYTIT
jgi:hypothetical protein